MQNLIGSFWKRWTKEYVSSLQERLKWKSENENLRIGDLVYLTDDNVAPLQWPQKFHRSFLSIFPLLKPKWLLESENYNNWTILFIISVLSHKL